MHKQDFVVGIHIHFISQNGLGVEGGKMRSKEGEGVESHVKEKLDSYAILWV